MRFLGIVLIGFILVCIALIVVTSKKLIKLKDNSNTEEVDKYKSTYIVTLVGAILLLIVCLVIAFILGSELFYDAYY